jgi:hypothetical protein
MSGLGKIDSLFEAKDGGKGEGGKREKKRKERKKLDGRVVCMWVWVTHLISADDAPMRALNSPSSAIHAEIELS